MVAKTASPGKKENGINLQLLLRRDYITIPSRYPGVNLIFQL
jgi:hypothetical protein